MKTNWENLYENTLKHFPCVRGNLHIWFSNLLKLQLTGLAINNVPGCTNCNFLSFSNLAVKGNRRMKCTFGQRRDVNQNMLYQSFGHSAWDWNNSSWRQELSFFFLTEYNYHFSDISIEWVKVHLDTVRFNLWHVIWGKFTYLWELSCKLTFSRIYINDLWIISQKKVWILWN